jgi:L-2,4-diaminobutyrate decarboxylase
MDLAAHMTERIAGSDDFEALPSTPDLSIVCFRHVPGGRDRAGEIDPQAMDDYQDRLQRALEVSGRGWVSTTKLRGRTYLRAGLVNHLSTDADVDRVLDTLRGASPEAAREAGIAAGG